jgi:hypothetical protein
VPGAFDSVNVTPLPERLTGRSRPPLSIVLGTVCLVLILALANAATLLLARGIERRQSDPLWVRAADG